MVKKFFCLDLTAAGLVIGGLEVIATVLSLLSYVAIPQIRSYITLVPLLIVIVIGISGWLLIIGINKRKHLLLIPWLVIQHIILVVLVFFIAAACVFVVDWMPKHTEVPKLSEVVRTVALFLETVLSFGLLAYAWLAMFSLYNQIHESQSDASRRIS